MGGWKREQNWREGEGRSLTASSRPRRWSAQAHSRHARLSLPSLRPGSFAAASAPPPPLFLIIRLLGLCLLFLLRPLLLRLRRLPRRGARSPCPAPGRAVPCCPGGGAEGWRRLSLRPPRGTCGCCGCCSLASSSARPCAVRPPAARVSECTGRRPRAGRPGAGDRRAGVRPRGAAVILPAAALARARRPRRPRRPRGPACEPPCRPRLSRVGKTGPAGRARHRAAEGLLWMGLLPASGVDSLHVFVWVREPGGSVSQEGALCVAPRPGVCPVGVSVCARLGHRGCGPGPGCLPSLLPVSVLESESQC